MELQPRSRKSEVVRIGSMIDPALHYVTRSYCDFNSYTRTRDHTWGFSFTSYIPGRLTNVVIHLTNT